MLQEIEGYTSLWLPIDNISVIIILIILYAILCHNLSRVNQIAHGKAYKIQLQVVFNRIKGSQV